MQWTNSAKTRRVEREVVLHDNDVFVCECDSVKFVMHSFLCITRLIMLSSSSCALGLASRLTAAAAKGEEANRQ